MKPIIIFLLLLTGLVVGMLYTNWDQKTQQFHLPKPRPIGLPQEVKKPPYQKAVDALMAGDLKSAQKLVETTKDLNAPNKFGDTTLIWAVNRGDTHLVQSLIDKKADPNIKGSGGRTALHWAVEQGHSDIVNILLEAKADVNALSTSGNSPLTVAISNQHVPFVHALLQAGADINAADNQGESPLTTAIRSRAYELATLLILNGASLESDRSGINPIALALENQMSSLFLDERLLAKYPDLPDRVNQIRKVRPTNNAQKTIVNIGELEARIHELVNRERTGHGLPALDYDPALAAISRAHSTDMGKRLFFNHINPDNEGPTERAKRVKYPTRKDLGATFQEGIGENIYKSRLYSGTYSIFEGTEQQVTYQWQTQEQLAQKTVQGWMNSPKHRENILDPRYDRQGLGIYINEDHEFFATENFF